MCGQPVTNNKQYRERADPANSAGTSTAIKSDAANKKAENRKFTSRWRGWALTPSASPSSSARVSVTPSMGGFNELQQNKICFIFEKNRFNDHGIRLWVLSGSSTTDPLLQTNIQFRILCTFSVGKMYLHFWLHAAVANYCSGTLKSKARNIYSGADPLLLLYIPDKWKITKI